MCYNITRSRGREGERDSPASMFSLIEHMMIAPSRSASVCVNYYYYYSKLPVSSSVITNKYLDCQNERIYREKFKTARFIKFLEITRVYYVTSSVMVGKLFKIKKANMFCLFCTIFIVIINFVLFDSMGWWCMHMFATVVYFVAKI